MTTIRIWLLAAMLLTNVLIIRMLCRYARRSRAAPRLWFVAADLTLAQWAAQTWSWWQQQPFVWTTLLFRLEVIFVLWAVLKELRYASGELARQSGDDRTPADHN